MGNKNKKNTIKDLFYPILGTLLISLSIYLFTFTTGDDYSKPSPTFVSENHILIDRVMKEKKYVKWDKKVMEAPKVELVHLSEKKTDTNNESEWINVVASFYTAKCSGCTGITYNGTNVTNTIYTPEGLRVIAVDPNIVPVDSIVKVRYGDTEFIAEAADIGGAIKGKRIDVLVKTKSKAFELGMKEAQVKIIQSGDEI